MSGASFVYGGLRFEVASDLPQRPRAALDASAPHHASVEVRTSVADVRRMAGPIRWVALGEAFDVSVMGLDATVRRVGDRRFTADVRVAESLADVDKGIAETLATTVGELSGGVVFHAAAIQHGECAVLFIGPSGAGKSTASRLVPDAREIAEDRALVVPTSRGYDVHALSMGTPSGLPRSEKSSYPLAAIHRVRHDGTRVGVEPLSRSVALAALRAAATTGRDASLEGSLLATLDELTRRVSVANVYTRLDRELVLPNLE